MTAGEDYMKETEKNLVENRQAVDANQVNTKHEFVPSNQPWPLTNNSVASLQSSHQMVYGSTENQRSSTIPGEASNGTNNPPYVPATSYMQPSHQQEYAGHTTYPSTGSYGYGSLEYQNQYCGYQHPANDSSHQHVGAGPNTGAPYQSLSSFQNENPYVGPTSYSDTYYNHGDYQTSNYQTALAYQSNSYNNQTTSWNGGIGGNVPPYEYSNYTSTEATGAHNITPTSGNPLHYQQQYGQWVGYYGQSTSSNVLCAPGTENLPVINTKNLGNPSSGHLYTNNQPPPPGTSSWRQDFTPPALPASQGKKDDAGCNQKSGWKVGEHLFQKQHDNQTKSYCQTALDSNHSDDQQKAFHSQSSNLQFPLTNQVSQNFQTSSQTTAPDTCQTSNMQIQTNPRIAPNLIFGVQKADKETISTRETLKPAYITVAPPKLQNNVATQNSSDNQKGFLPASLRTYVERTFARCKDDTQRTVNQDIMKDIITKASADGTLLTRNWDTEPLFPLPKTTLQNSANSNQNFASLSFSADHGKSPKRRVKSRWEPLPEEKMAIHTSSTKEVSQDLTKGNKKVGIAQTFDGKNNNWCKMKFVPAQKQSLNTASPLKRQRFGESNSDENGHASSDSDIEQSLTKYHSSAITLANSPEERKKRENRVRRFEKRQIHKSESTTFKAKNVGAATMYSRRTNVQFLAKNYEDNTNRAVEDIDWDSLTVKGTCQEIAKHYLRLTSAPDPGTVRPADVLEKALLMVKSSHKNYLYKCDQLKSIRQDLTVQRIQNELTVKVYETHARLALEAGDLSEYNQCQSQLKRLYSDGINGCQLEFYAYNLLRVILHSSNNRELLMSMSRLSGNAKEDVAVRHALAVRAAVTSNNYVVFFRLYKKAPNLNTHLMDLYVEKMRFEAIRCICKSYRPGIPISYICRVLGFSKMDLPEDCMEYKDTNGLEECDDWLRAHGAVLTSDNKGEVQLDTKASSSTLYMPEPEDAVSHGDATLAVGDFMTRTCGYT